MLLQGGLARYCIIFIPFSVATSTFLSTTFIPISFKEIVFTILGEGICAANLYLYIFNKNTRQSYHDLLTRTFVVENMNSAPKMDCQKPISNIHYIMSILLIIIIVFYSFFIQNNVNNNISTDKINVISKEISSNNKNVILSSISVESIIYSNDGNNEKPSIKVNVFLNKEPIEPETEINKIVQIIIKELPIEKNGNSIEVSLNWGFDIGIAQIWKNIMYCMASTGLHRQGQQ